MSYMEKFVDRKYELDFLNEKFSLKSSEFIIFYGNRRIGKTFLLKHFMADKNAIYFLAEKNNLNIKRMQHQMAIFLSNKHFAALNINTFYELFEAFYNFYNDKKRLVLVMDEFSYMVEHNNSVLSEFQRIWDEILINKNIMFCINGSSYSTMVGEVLNVKSPLYGRKTAAFKLDGMDYKYFKEFSSLEKKDLAFIYGATDNITYYLTFLKDTSFYSNIKQLFLVKGAPLRDEVNFLMLQSFRELKNYSIIFEALANGKNAFNEIVNFTGIDKSALFRYLEILINFNYVKKNTSAFAKINSKNSRYTLSNKLFNFYFKFLRDNRELLELGKVDELLLYIKENYEEYFSTVFEELSRNYLQRKNNVQSVNSYWHKEVEIDIVGIDNLKKKIYFGECKWTGKKVGKDLFDSLKEKVASIKLPEKYADYRIEYILFSKSGFKTDLKNVTCELIQGKEVIDYLF